MISFDNIIIITFIIELSQPPILSSHTYNWSTELYTFFYDLGKNFVIRRKDLFLFI